MPILLILIQDSVISNSSLSPNSPWDVSSTEGLGDRFAGKKEGLADLSSKPLKVCLQRGSR